MSPRVWQQEIVNWGDIATLRLWHPDGRKEVHRFEPDVLEQVKRLSWSPISDAYAQARLPNNGGMTRLHWIVIGSHGEGSSYESTI